MKAREVIDLMIDNDLTPHNVWYEDYDDVDEIGEVQEMEREGGREGGGEAVSLVIYLPKFDIHLAIDASYYSGSGVDYFSDWYEVKPKQVMVTVYQRN